MATNNEKGRCCCSANSSCCSSEVTARGNEAQNEKSKLEIDFLFLDLDVCVPCRGTEESLEEAIAEASRVFEAAGVEVIVNKTKVEDEEQARELGFISSPTIRINGRDIQLDVKESLCESCGDLCGEDVDCRVWVYQGKEYNIPPKAMIVDAILKEVYGAKDGNLEVQSRPADIPENLKRFFKAKRNKESK